MKLKFKEQHFQLQAVKAVVACFNGQPLKSASFTLKKTAELIRSKRRQAKGISELENLDTEIDELIGYRNSPVQISETQVLHNINQVQRENDLRESPKLERPRGFGQSYHLTVEMETGTGKTYTYIRTMYELHKHYGWSKFIVIVPSIAIREGVYKSFQITQEHFQEIYGHKISPFVYNSSRPQEIENLASDNRISVMIINTQAFNARGTDARRIRLELDQFGSRRPIDILAQTNPIIIIDEPQSVEGEKTLEGIRDFNPLFVVGYSATHKVEYNKIFRLDALDAYDRKLVKRIQVKGINLKNSTGTSGYLYLEQIVVSAKHPPYAIVEYEKRSANGPVKKIREKLTQGANLYELSGNLPAYQNHTITEINGYHNKIVVAGQDIYAGDAINHPNELTFRRIQIRETIASHLQKEKQLFELGVKTLSLFFIDSVDKYRQYNDAGEVVAGDYAQIFEEEYQALLTELLDQSKDEISRGYYEYLLRDSAPTVHKGYFSIDKTGKSVNPVTKRGSEESDDISAYDLIMKDKERLLSFEEPTRFIFSHSALKEGWDNPNVFQICALKSAETGSQIRRRQEIGRGMRLCVDKNGVRLDYETVGERVHEINKLTVIASESYESFAKGLQSEIADSIKDRPQKADERYLVGKLVVDERGKQHRLTEEDARKLNRLWFKYDIIGEDDRITAMGKELIDINQVPLPENLEEYRPSIHKLLKSIYSGESYKVEDNRKTVYVRPNDNLKKKEFLELWEKINIKTIYEVRFDTARLVEQSAARIDEQLAIGDVRYQVKSGELESGTVEQLHAKELIKEKAADYYTVSTEIYANVTYDIVGEIEKQTNLTRRTIVAILQSISPDKFALLQKNPEEFIRQCGKLINEVKASLIINNIVYHKTHERYDARTVFTNDKSVLRSETPLRKHIYDFLTSDSMVEAEFAKALENSTEVVVYAKLPKSFYITTPVANYSPDWAIVFDKEKVRHIYFVAETKGTDSDLELREIEKLKIHCAAQHFKEISGGVVKFSKVNSYARMLEIIQST